MKLKMFALYDSKAEAFGPPFFLDTIGQAVRALMDIVNDNQSMVSRHPADFVLYEVGDYDSQTAVVNNKNPHSLIGLAMDYSNKKVLVNGMMSEKEIKEVV